MTSLATATYTITGWTQLPWNGDSAEKTGPKLFRVEHTHHYAGDIEGDATAQYLVAHNPDGTGSFVALEQINGSVGGKAGSFVLQRIGRFGEARITESVTVLAGSATGELEGLWGEGTTEHAAQQEHHPVRLAYEISRGSGIAG